jgi:4-aminobutyrate aminotransferase-like enzyme
MMTLALTGKVAAYKAGFGPFPADVYHIPYPDPLRGVTVDAIRRGLGQLFQATIDPKRVAAIVVEPVQGEGGSTPQRANSCACFATCAISTASF